MPRANASIKTVQSDNWGCLELPGTLYAIRDRESLVLRARRRFLPRVTLEMPWSFAVDVFAIDEKSTAKHHGTAGAKWQFEPVTHYFFIMLISAHVTLATSGFSIFIKKCKFSVLECYYPYALLYKARIS